MHWLRSHQALRRSGSLTMTLAVSLVCVACQSRGQVVDIAVEEQGIREASLAFSKAERSGKADSALTFMWETR